jgi:hypothetical protein
MILVKRKDGGHPEGGVAHVQESAEEQSWHTVGERCGSMLAKMKQRQAHKIREIRHELVNAGYQSLGEQAEALGLSRSTTWAMLNGNYKGSGLSVAIINRMLDAPDLPPRVRQKVLEYVEEKAAGLYGHNETQRTKFTSRLIAHVEQPKLRKAG